MVIKSPLPVIGTGFFICNASQNKTVYLRNQNFISVDSGTIESDYLVIGSGLAGLYSALKAARHGTVTLVTKSGLDVSSSYWAQGGVAAVDRKSTRLNSSHVAISYDVI